MHFVYVTLEKDSQQKGNNSVISKIIDWTFNITDLKTYFT